MDAFAFELFSRPNPFPCARDLDKNVLAVNASLFVHLNESVRLGKRAFHVEAKPGIDLRGNPSGDNLEDLTAEAHKEVIHARLRARRRVTRNLRGVPNG